jgi:hypothetical protein
VALAVTVPLSAAVTSPVALIVASVVPLLIDQVTVWVVALAGDTATVSCVEPLSVVIVGVPVTVIPVIGMTWFVIVIVLSPKIPEPSFAVALAVTVPLSAAVTSPVALIVASVVPVLIDQVTVWVVAFAGDTDAVSCVVPLSVVIVGVPVTVIPVTGMTWLDIMIVISPYIPVPSLAVALAVTVPLSAAVTSPVALIVARVVPLLIDQATVWVVALAGAIVAVSCVVPLSVVIVCVPVTVIPVTGITWFVIVIVRSQ